MENTPNTKLLDSFTKIKYVCGFESDLGAFKFFKKKNIYIYIHIYSTNTHKNKYKK